MMSFAGCKSKYKKPLTDFLTKYKNYLKSPQMDGDKVVKYVDKILFKEYAESKGVDTAQILLGPFDDADDIKLSDIPNN